MQSILKISDAAGLAIHAITLIGRNSNRGPIKIPQLARILNASEAHLGKVMHRLSLAKLVQSKRGPKGGYVLGPNADRMTVLDLYEMFDGPLATSNCILGHESCLFGSCVFEDAIEVTHTTIKAILSQKIVSELSAH